MTPLKKYHLCITIVTVSIMAIVLTNLIPWLERRQLSTPWLGLIVGAVGSTAIYTGFAKILSGLLESNRLLKKLLFGKDDLQGTWIGMYQRADGCSVYSVEHFEQSLETLNIKGKGFTETGETINDWTSTASAIESKDKKLIYTYTCDRYGGPEQFQGVCVFSLERPSSSSRPMVIHGYSADLTHGARKTENREVRIDDDFLDMKKVAFQKALEQFETHADEAVSAGSE